MFLNILSFQSLTAFGFKITFASMGIVFRQSVKTSIVTFAGAFCGAIIIYIGAKFIPKQELGFLRNTLPEQAALFAQILSFGLNATLTVYVLKYAIGDPRRKALISMSIILPALLFLLIVPFYFIFKPSVVGLFQTHDIPLISKFYGWLPLLTVFFLYLLLFEQYLNSQLKVAASTFMREVLLRVLTIGAILLYGFELIDYDTLVPLSVLIFLIPLFLLFWLSAKTEGFGISFKWGVFSKKERKELASFSWYHFLLTISINLMAKLDIILLAMWASLSAAAIYGIAVYILSFLQIPYRAMLSASFPVLTHAYHEGDMSKVKDVFVRSSLNILVASVGLAAIICCNLHNVVAVLPEGYEPITPIVLILIIGKLFDISTGMNDQLLSITNHYRFMFIVSVAVVVLLVALSFILIPPYSYYGAAVATAASLVAYNFSKLFFIWRKLGLQPFSKKSLVVLLAGIVTFAAGYFIPFILNAVTDAIVRTAVIMLLYLLLLLVLKPSDDLNTYIASVRKNKRLF